LRRPAAFPALRIAPARHARAFECNHGGNARKFLADESPGKLSLDEGVLSIPLGGNEVEW